MSDILFTVDHALNDKMTKAKILDRVQPVQITFRMIATEFLYKKLNFPVADQVADWLFSKKAIGFNARGVIIAIPEIHVSRWEDALKANNASTPTQIEWYRVNDKLCKQYFWAY
jgi:hypothetical protein